jgi:hypothetical protein
LDPLHHKPLERAHSDSCHKATRQRASAHVTGLGEVDDGQRLIEAFSRPLENAAQPVTKPSVRDRRLYVLRLTTLSVGRRHHPARKRIRNSTPMIATNELDAEIDSRGRSRRGEHLPVLDVEHGGVDRDARESASQLGGVHPMGRRAPPIKKTRSCKNERP